MQLMLHLGAAAGASLSKLRYKFLLCINIIKFDNNACLTCSSNDMIGHISLINVAFMQHSIPAFNFSLPA